MNLLSFIHISRKNDWPFEEAHTLVIDMCAGQLERPNIVASSSSLFSVNLLNETLERYILLICVVRLKSEL